MYKTSVNLVGVADALCVDNGCVTVLIMHLSFLMNEQQQTYTSTCVFTS